MARALDRLASWWGRPGTRGPEAGAAEDLLQAVERARLDYLAAQRYFQSVTEPALIDHAIHRESAAERHYIFLIRKARDEGARLPLRPSVHRS